MAEASYIPLTEEALDDLKEYIKRCVSHAEYRSGETWEKIPIYKVETLVDSCCLTMTRRTRSRGSVSITKTAFCGLAGMKA